MQTCEKCNKKARGEYELFDYCATCSKNLCPDCMAAGHCGEKPAKSGMEADDWQEIAEKTAPKAV
jgi:hypothetical protein